MNCLDNAERLAAELVAAVAAGATRDAARFTWWDLEHFRGRSAAAVRAAGVSETDARHVVARESGFANWERLVAFRQAWNADPAGPEARFEAIAQAVVDGDAQAVRQLLTTDPSLASARSARDHHATLLHYLAANGVEDDRQRTPANAAEIARILFDSGARSVVDATAEIYGGGPGSTPLVALVTSAHPYQAGLQPELIRLFCEAGADANGIDQSGQPLQLAIGFRYLDAARTLVEWGARVDNLPAAAALGDDSLVESMLAEDRRQPSARCQFPNPHHPELEASLAPHPNETIQQAFVFAAMGGRPDLVDRLLKAGGRINAPARGGIRAIHEAAWQGDAAMVRHLLGLGADPEIRDDTWDSTAAEWAQAGAHTELAGFLARL